ncbi:MAG TPA: stage 0 sporulation family protein [Firmicutes bacterium]|nr:stage 0 sporulation family protein [Candidatus Fermentithermobacillaceae bacterium]
MPLVTGIRFKEKGKVYYFDPGDIPLKAGDKVLVETVKGIEIGVVAAEPRDVPDDNLVLPLRKVIRPAGKEDLDVAERNEQKAVEALDIAAQKIAQHGLEMRLVDAEYTFDSSRVTLYFTADGRVDFRELVKDLASALRTRVELRQIGVRDEAKFFGGLGPCGRELCCASFLCEFQPVSIRMAKEQNLPLNPSKISGTCGRLLCCLRFESESVDVGKTQEPPIDIGAYVITPAGEGKVTGYSQSKGLLTVLFEDGTMSEFPEEEVDVKK